MFGDRPSAVVFVLMGWCSLPVVFVGFLWLDGMLFSG